MTWAVLGTMFVLYEAAIIALLMTRDAARTPAPGPDPGTPSDDDYVRTVVLPRFTPVSAAARSRDEWAAKARDLVAVDSVRWPHLMPAWQDDTGSFAALLGVA